MSGRLENAWVVRFHRWMFRAWMPPSFRDDFDRPALDAFEDLYREARASTRSLAVTRLLVRETASLALVGWRERFGRRRKRPPNGSASRPKRSAPLHDLRADLKVGCRHLRRRPWFTAVALVTLALGIGMNTAILSLADAVFLAPMPYPDSERLGVVSTELVQGGSGFSASYLDLRDLVEQNRVFDEVAFFLDWQSVNLSGGDRPERASVNFVTPSYLEMLGFRPAIGRLFVSDDDGTGPRGAVVILSHALWQRNFGGDADVVGRTVVLNDVPFEIVGVLSENVSDLAERYDESASAYVPLGWVQPLAQLDVWERRGARYLFGLARLRRGVSREEAIQDLHRVSAGLARDYPDTNEGWRFVLEPVSELLLGNARESTWVLLGGAGLVLLLVCANLAGLLLLQGIRRSRELAMRRALGADGSRVVRQLVTESLLLSVLGGALGTVVAFWGTELLSGVDAFRLPSFVSLTLDARALGVSFVLATFTGLVFGIAPARRAGNVDALAGLRGGRSVADRGVARAAFLVSEIALAVVLLAGAVLLFESFRRLHQTDFGFETDGLLSAQLDLRGERYDEPQTRRAVAEDLVERTGSLAGVDEAFVWSPSRIGGGNWVRFITRENRFHEVNERVEASRHHVLPGAIGKLGIPILAGRDFTASDGPDAPRVAIVSQALTTTLWPGENAVGKRFDAAVRQDVVTYEVIGVAANARHRSRVNGFLEADYDLYFPYRQEPERYLGLLVRASDSRAGSSLVPVLRRAVQQIDSALPLYDITTMSERMRREESRSRVSAILVSGYAALAMALAAIGIYGTLALAVRQRAHEIGVRIALGARRVDIIRQVLGYGGRVFITGAALGLVGAFAVARMLGSALYGVTSLDAPRLTVIVTGLALVAAAGCFVPARQASQVDPTVALREET